MKSVGHGARTTANGYNFSEATSAMQKCIRRGLTNDALYWAHELHTRYHHYVWRRLMLITNEDIGIARPWVITAIPDLAEQRELDRHALAKAVTLLCDGPKTRLVDRLTIVISLEQEIGWRPRPAGEVEEMEAGFLDRLRARDEEAACDYAFCLTPVQTVTRIHAATPRQEHRVWGALRTVAWDLAVRGGYPFALKALSALEACYDDMRKKKGYALDASFFFVQGILLLCRRPVMEPPPFIDVQYKHQFDGRKVPDFALDRHTGRGRAKGRDFRHFLEEGMVVIPDDPRFAEAYLQRYIDILYKYNEDKQRYAAGNDTPPAAARKRSSGQAEQVKMPF